MARYGKVLLQRLTFQYCDRLGCAQGVREYLDQLLPKFQQAHPHIETSMVLKRNRFPLVKAEYALLPSSAVHLKRQLRREAALCSGRQPNASTSSSSGSSSSNSGSSSTSATGSSSSSKQAEAARLTSNVIGLKHCSAAEVREVVWWLSQSQNRPKTRSIPTKHIASKRPSIQGEWTASTFM